jgi:hypothetical protein
MDVISCILLPVCMSRCVVLPCCFQGLDKKVQFISVLWIRIRMEPEILSGWGSGIILNFWIKVIGKLEHNEDTTVN